MKNVIRVLIVFWGILIAGDILARDSINNHSIASALNHPEFENKVGTAVRFYFGDQTVPAIEKKIRVYNTTRKTHAIGKTDQQACEWAFLSTLIALRDSALREGGDAVINIQSTYKGGIFNSKTEFRCGAGDIMAGVSLQGTVVKLK
ncbi:excinuclease ABC subunit A [Teredinibacter sp. KSP-S5-2]|uniref:excinuclease ABC subunit A n=1 Tax=Teredinibacter sp. KSP-S5-2 TaxID=3034506 RepID=UPI002934F886|nr:excinuclease ABC subunit A [Teredinibacter sp. KSP-S5-2]WNO09552.1 excinuclease ABC subunit A [Teredinibacter sp. KSP-S5-2]